MHTDPDVIAVRADEQLHVHSLQQYLRTQFPEATGALEVQQFAGGHANLTYLLRMGEHEWVLRRPPLGPTLPTAHDMRREYRVLSALATTTVPVPRPLLLCDDLRVLGVPFYLMERCYGFVIRDHLPPELGDAVGRRRQVCLAAVDALATLHGVAWQASGLHDFGRPTGYLERQLQRWPQQWARAKTRELPQLDRVLEWLRRHLPPTTHTTIVHGDYKLDNIMFAIHNPSQVTAILDWEMSTLGDPLADLGWLLAYWPQPGDSANRTAGWRTVTLAPGFLRRHELVARYEEQTGRRATHIDFYEVFGLYKNAVILEGIYARFVAGQTQDARFLELGAQVPQYAEAAWEVVQHARL
jgi:aminoglycoside phosphotransferase (APT) family kinase protein